MVLASSAVAWNEATQLRFQKENPFEAHSHQFNVFAALAGTTQTVQQCKTHNCDIDEARKLFECKLADVHHQGIFHKSCGPIRRKSELFTHIVDSPAKLQSPSRQV